MNTRHVKNTNVAAHRRCHIGVMGVVLALAPALLAEPPPLGHPDFYPSPERPVGWRGDWTGAWPGGDAVTYWDAELGENIVWTVNTPGAGFSQPIVVGEKVFVTCEPNWLMCYSVHTGEELWRTAIDHTMMMDPETAEKARSEIKYFDDLMLRRGRWSTETEDLTVMVDEAGFDSTLVWENRPHYRVLRKPQTTGDKGNPPMATAITKLWERLYAEQEEYGLSYTGDAHGHTWTGEINERAARASRLYDIWFDGSWDGFCPSWPTPCSDGERIYVSMQNNAVAAVDLDGRVAWMVWEHLGDGNGERNTRYDQGMATRFALSPVLYENYFLVDADGHMRVYDKHTGEKIWENIDRYGARQRAVEAKGHEYDFGRQLPEDCIHLDWTAILKEHSDGTGRQRPVHGARPRNEACSPVVAKVPLPDGSTMPVIFDGNNFLLRLEDGHVLSADMPFASCSSAVRDGNVVMGKWGEQGGYAVRLTAKDRDTLDYTWLHYWYGRGARNDIPLSRAPKDFRGFTGSDTGIACDGWWYGSPTRGFRVSLEDGRLERCPGNRQGGNPSPIIVGNRLVSFGEVELYSRGAFNFRKSVPDAGVGPAEVTDFDNGRAYHVERSHVDRRLAEDSDYALRYAYVKAGRQGGNASPCAQANRMFHRTKGVLYCIGDPGDVFPAPTDCPDAAKAPTPSFVAAIEAVNGVANVGKLTAYLGHEHPAVRAAAARKVSSVRFQVSGEKGDGASSPEPETRNLNTLLQRLAREDSSPTVRAAAIVAMGTGPDEPGCKALAELAAVAGSAGPWQHCKPELQRLMHVLRALGPDAEPALVSVLQGSDSKAQEAVASAVYDGDVTLTDGLRDALLAFVGNPKLDQGLVALALARWPEDEAVAAVFAEALVGRNATPVMFEYLLPLQKPGERLAFLRTMVARSSRDVRTMAIGVMVGEGRVEAIRPMMAAARGREPAEIARGLAAACEDHADANLRKTAVAIISEHLAQDDTYCQMNMVRALGEFGADAAPALTAIKAIDPGDDTRLKEACEQAVAKIERAKQQDKRE